ncbi:MAG: flagellar export protein FliJ [Planctomycetes bacterium TMED75]|nr:flagellar export protein FliJ [Planctomycetaceae bacterium]OUU90637.1 MAG: flagellar export protein FliJ [Planctomycetes bacterium TMED75]
MASFRFKLQALLDLRLREETTCRIEFSKLMGQKSDIEQRLIAHQQTIQAGKDSMREGMVGKVDALALRLQSHAALGLMREAQAAAIALAGLAKRIETSRSKLDVARSRRRAVEVLRERRYEEWKLQQERREVSDQDELATFSAFRRDSDS